MRGTRSSPLGAEDIVTMQTPTSTRTPDTTMMLLTVCLFSDAIGHWSISTGKIRDTETGNYYFGARYMSTIDGRFMSPDWSAKVEPVPYAKLDNPQSLNLYSYVWNNPLSRIDLDGHYLCKGDECDQVKAALSELNKLESSKNLTAAQQAALKQVVAFYGEAGVNNGVTVNTGTAGVGANGGTFTDKKGHTTISLKLSNWDSTKGLTKESIRIEKVGTVAHEGEHGVQQKDHGMPRSAEEEYLGELQAFGVQGDVNRASGVKSAYGIWSPSGGFNERAIQTGADKSTNLWCGGCWHPNREEEPQ
jgi:RHS repeat-associated protein